MECLEEGELPSSPEEPSQSLEMEQSGASAQPIYTPLPRPQVVPSSKQISAEASDTFSSSATNRDTSNIISPSMKYSNPEQRVASSTYKISSSDSDSSAEDTDSDSQCNKTSASIRSRGKKIRRFRIQAASNQTSGMQNDGGEGFQNAVKAYQNSIRHNNGTLPNTWDREKRKGTGKNNVWGSILNEDALTNDLTSIAVGRKSVKDLNSDRGAEVVFDKPKRYYTNIQFFLLNSYNGKK